MALTWAAWRESGVDAALWKWENWPEGPHLFPPCGRCPTSMTPSDSVRPSIYEWAGLQGWAL